MAAAIGLSPSEMKASSIWEFFAAVEGFAKANSPDDGTLTKSEEDELFEMVQAKAAGKR